MPFTLTRSILVVVIPGLVALGPWSLWVVFKIGNFEELYKSYSILINASLVGVAVIIGSMFEGLLSHLEVRWDKEREQEFKVRDNWFDYLAQQCSAEPVGFRYISRMLTTMYFELSMMVAAPLSLTGIAVLIYDHSPSWRCLGAAALVLLASGAVWFFFREAKSTHGVLCEARKEINSRLKNSR